MEKIKGKPTEEKKRERLKAQWRKASAKLYERKRIEKLINQAITIEEDGTWLVPEGWCMIPMTIKCLVLIEEDTMKKVSVKMVGIKQEIEEAGIEIFPSHITPRIRDFEVSIPEPLEEMAKKEVE